MEKKKTLLGNNALKMETDVRNNRSETEKEKREKQRKDKELMRGSFSNRSSRNKNYPSFFQAQTAGRCCMQNQVLLQGQWKKSELKNDGDEGK